jgi:hypothetical protein
MNPSIELRLKTMMRAVTEVILPAVDPNNSLAQEQTRLLLGHLHALLLQHAHAAELGALTRADAEALARQLLAQAAGGARTLAAADRLRTALASDESSALNHAVEDLLIASGEDGDPMFVANSTRLVLNYSRAQALHGRAWFKAMGFDSTPGSLPDVPTLIAGWSASSANTERQRSPLDHRDRNG